MLHFLLQGMEEIVNTDAATLFFSDVATSLPVQLPSLFGDSPVVRKVLNNGKHHITSVANWHPLGFYIQMPKDQMIPPSRRYFMGNNLLKNFKDASSN